MRTAFTRRVGTTGLLVLLVGVVLPLLGPGAAAGVELRFASSRVSPS